MTNEEAEREFIGRLDEVDGPGIFNELRDKGTAAEFLPALGTFEFMDFPLIDIDDLEIPAYGRGFGYTDGYGLKEEKTWWTPGARAITMRDWYLWLITSDRRREDIDGKFAYYADAEALLNAGPSLAIRDEWFGVTVLVDGCHRALTRASQGMSIPMVVYSSPLAHMLIFPTHFLPRAYAASNSDSKT